MLATLLDEHDAIARMQALPAFDGLPAWAGRDHDAAIASFVAELVGGDDELCVRVALAALNTVRGYMPDAPVAELAVDPSWLDLQIAAVERYLELRDEASAELAGQTIDVTRQTSAWRDFDVADGWIGEATDFAVQAVRAPSAYVAAGCARDPRTCAVLAAICATRALVCAAIDADQATLAVARAVVAA